MRATIIILNGVGSVGKSSIAKVLQDIAAEPFLHVQMDTFMEMLPKVYQEHRPGFTYRTIFEGGKPLVVIESGPVGKRALQGMRHAIAAMAEQGNNLIVDDVLCDGEMPEYLELLSPFNLHLVGLFAPLEIIEARERERGDRMPGLARWRYDRVHQSIHYDLKIDTSLFTHAECAGFIKDKFGL